MHTHTKSPICAVQKKDKPVVISCTLPPRCYIKYSFFLYVPRLKSEDFLPFICSFLSSLLTVSHTMLCAREQMAIKKVYASERDVLVAFLQFQLTTKNNQEEINFSRKEECQMTRESRLMSGV